jgi:5'-deoxynucleotidase YfbR-like HD superfamily hydrolase
MPNFSTAEIEQDVDQIIWSMKLCSVIRYRGQRFWEEESQLTETALAVDTIRSTGETIPRSESVADHSWHMADMALLLAPRFPELDLGKCLALATLHDKMEIIMGDHSPLGKDGTGHDTHAFNAEKRQEKDAEEKRAIDHYITQLHPQTAAIQQELLLDMLHLISPESRFVKALDRIQPLAYIIARKAGHMENAHLIFTVNYLKTNRTYFPALAGHFNNLMHRFFESMAEHRQVTLASLKEDFPFE